MAGSWKHIERLKWNSRRKGQVLQAHIQWPKVKENVAVRGWYSASFQGDDFNAGWGPQCDPRLGRDTPNSLGTVEVSTCVLALKLPHLYNPSSEQVLCPQTTPHPQHRRTQSLPALTLTCEGSCLTFPVSRSHSLCECHSSCQACIACFASLLLCHHVAAPSRDLASPSTPSTNT